MSSDKPLKRFSELRMNIWLAIPSAISAAMLGGGLISSELSGASVPAALCLIVGASIGVVIMSIWGVGLLRPRASAERGSDEASVGRLTELAKMLEAQSFLAQEKGILMLADSSLSKRRSLFAKGCALLVSGESASDMRREMNTFADEDAQREVQRLSRRASICRILPMVALSATIVSIALVSARVFQGEVLSGAWAFVLLGVVYGSFSAIAVASSVQGSIQQNMLEFELSGVLVIETLVGLRQGDAASTIADRLRGILQAGRSDAELPRFAKAA